MDGSAASTPSATGATSSPSTSVSSRCIRADVSLDRLEIPPAWGILVCSDGGTLRSKRKPARLSDPATYGASAPLTRHVMAAFARAAQRTTERVCAGERVAP